ncbi:hypothetical protein D3C71_1740710 [compost metagenome]
MGQITACHHIHRILAPASMYDNRVERIADLYKIWPNAPHRTNRFCSMTLKHGDESSNLALG